MWFTIPQLGQHISLGIKQLDSQFSKAILDAAPTSSVCSFSPLACLLTQALSGLCSNSMSSSFLVLSGYRSVFEDSLMSSSLSGCHTRHHWLHSTLVGQNLLPNFFLSLSLQGFFRFRNATFLHLHLLQQSTQLQAQHAFRSKYHQQTLAK
jgi:hypothetical protein